MKRQPEPLVLCGIGDTWNRGKSFVIPLPHKRALRFGAAIDLDKKPWGIDNCGLRWWCLLGPRRYTVVAAPSFVKSYSDVLGGTEDEVREMLRENGVRIQGDLGVVPE